MLPVYRLSEGAENLENNYDTFEKCKAIFRKGGIVLIFSEGRCVNEWALRPLKKGTARLAESSWREGIPLRVVPAGINYQSFTSFGKNVQLNFGNIIHETPGAETNGYGKTIIGFNETLQAELEKLVITADGPGDEKLRRIFAIPVPGFERYALAVPALLGFLLHAPLYLPVRTFCRVRAGRNGHYDSLMVGVLFILYPVYLVILSVVFYIAWGVYTVPLVWILCPILAWSYVRIKKQF